MWSLGMVKVDAGLSWSNDSPRGESIFVTGSPKIYHEQCGGTPMILALREKSVTLKVVMI